ncbi:MAG TPA: phosphoglycerate kinase [Gemmatimonadales bacterium]|nr:phosphoglycerate kinase [Gemmatimonadales bacterium]HRX18114.1 phosphoglycerate kinase [Gemmatimonadales bacterium]
MSARRLADLDAARLDGQRVVVRADLNVPLADGAVADDTRIRASLPTIRFLREHGARVVLLSHLGRPKGAPDPRYSLRPVARALEAQLGIPVTFLADPTSDAAAAEVRHLPRGGVALGENTRFYPGEEANDPALADRFAALGDLFVNDAFGTAHRAHASTEAIAHRLKPAVSGFLLERELRFLGEAIEQPARPFVAILGGAKISGKIDLIEALLPKVDRILIGGAMACTFFKAMGLEVGRSLVEDDRVEMAARLLAAAGDKLMLPTGAMVGDRLAGDATTREVARDAIPADMAMFDIDQASVARFTEVITAARTVIWNGPMGVFETPPFDRGTMGVARALAAATAAGAITIVGGGDSAAAIAAGGLDDQVSHVSTGGGASLEFLEGKPLPGVQALDSR